MIVLLGSGFVIAGHRLRRDRPTLKITRRERRPVNYDGLFARVHFVVSTMPNSRAEFLRSIRSAIQCEPSLEHNRAVIEALLLTAATIANSMSQQSVGFSSAHIEESASRMAEELESTFKIDVLR